MNLSNMTHYGYETISNNSVYNVLTQNAQNRSKAELAELDKSIDSLTSTSIKVNFNESNFKNQVYFKDEISGEYIKIGLSDENLAKLESVFGKQDFFTRNDGSQILSGKAESFVAGWFGDIAYKRGYASSDSDNNGYLSQDELANTNSGFTAHGIYNLHNMNTISQSTESYMELGEDFKNKHVTSYAAGKYASDSIEAELNKTLLNDKNSDGKIAYGEMLDKNEHDQDVTDIINQIYTGEDLLKKLFCSNLWVARAH